MTGLELVHARVEDARRASAPPCLAPWPSDPPGPGYLGTRCTRSAGHQDQGLHHGVRLGGRLLEWHA